MKFIPYVKFSLSWCTEVIARLAAPIFRSAQWNIGPLFFLCRPCALRSIVPYLLKQRRYFTVYTHLTLDQQSVNIYIYIYIYIYNEHLLPVSIWQRANARNVGLYYPYWQYTNLFIFQFSCSFTMPTQARSTLQLLYIYGFVTYLIFLWKKATWEYYGKLLPCKLYFALLAYIRGS